jgi:hypothetical protein
MTKLKRQTVDLSDHPDLVVIRAGMRAESVVGFWKLMKYGYQIIKSVNGTDDSKPLTPDGLLHMEDEIHSLWPPHLVIRQYWEDFDSLEEWTQTGTHRELWDELAESPEGTAFWHELYSRDGIEAVYNGMDDAPIGMMNFAPTETVDGELSSARDRLQNPSDSAISSLYSDESSGD